MKKDLKKKITKICILCSLANDLLKNFNADSRDWRILLPEPLQKIIVTKIVYPKLSLQPLNKNDSLLKKLDFVDKNDRYYELKSTAKEDGAVGITEIQMLKANYLIWLFVDYEKMQLTFKKINLGEQCTSHNDVENPARKLLIECAMKDNKVKSSFKIKKFFMNKSLDDYKKTGNNFENCIIDMCTLERII